MDLTTILSFATGVLAGIITALTIIAPKTATSVDDRALELALKAKDILDAVAPKEKAKAVAKVVAADEAVAKEAAKV